GAALGESVYDDPAWRHAHDIDLLLPPAEVERAAKVMTDLGFREAPRLRGSQGRDFRHQTELPVLLLERAYRVGFYRAPFELLDERSHDLTRDGLGTIRVLDPTDALLHCLGHASYSPGRSNLLWVVDAWMIMKSGGGVDWEVFDSRAADMRIEVPLATMIRYLADEIDAPIPPDTVARAVAALATADTLRRDVALFGARQSLAGHPDLRGRTPLSWRGRLRLLRWELLPSPDYLDWAYDGPSRLTLPAIYVSRPVSALAERVKWRVIRAVRRRG
ncbi:MAG: hypothetical protein HKN71_11780, partial [Gemmatimonadetes bacterium]|nr:hypothetical protein [Gemmatimonadota bacterium]